MIFIFIVIFRGSQMGRKESRQDQRQEESWNNVPTKAARINEKLDITKLKISNVDTNTMVFGPPRHGGTWGRGSMSKKASVQEVPVKHANRYLVHIIFQEKKLFFYQHIFKFFQFSLN